MRLASSYLVFASSFKYSIAAENAFFISNQRLTFDQAKLFCSEDGYLAEGNERNINNLVTGKTLWMNGEQILNNLSLTDENMEHFALCKKNDTLGPSSINTDPFLDDIRYTQEQADYIASQNENAFDLPVGKFINKKAKLLEHSRNPRAAMLDGKWPGENDVTMTSLTIPIRFQRRGFASAEEAMILEFVHDISNYVEGCVTFIDDTESAKYEPYILVRRYDSNGEYDPGCWSYVGNVDDSSQSLNLGRGCMSKRTVQHEFLHALGFFHEHTRPDRDQYIKVNFENIRPEMARNYASFTERGFGFNDMGIPYDWNSVMHYKSDYWITAEAYTSNPRGWTMTKLDGQPIFPHSPRMTSIDSKQLALQYPDFCKPLKMEKCSNGEEILLNRKCDSVVDCADGSDEQGCGDYDCPRVIKITSSKKIDMLGIYDKKRGLYNGRSYWKRRGRSMFLYYAKGKWMINREIHDFYANMESLNGDISCPGLSKHWNYYDGGAREWVILSDLKIECHGSRCGSDADNCEKHDCDENAYCTVNPFVKDGYVCNCLDDYEGDGKTCRLPCTAEGGIDDSHYKVIVDEDNASFIDQEYARYLCQQHGPTWDLAFINFRHEFYYLVDLISGNCLDQKSFWFGYTKDGKDFDTVFGKSSSWKLASHLKKYDKANNKNKDLDCVRMENGMFTRVPCTSTSGAYVCENHNYGDRCQASQTQPKIENRYFISNDARKGWEESRKLCKKRGLGWDLAVINNQEELDAIVEMTNCAENAFWLGQIDQQGVLVDVNGEEVKFAPWDMHTNIRNPGSNDQIGVENCVRLRGNVINDAMCLLQHTGLKTQNIPMGYICEYEEPECIPKENANLDIYDYKIVMPDSPETVNFEEARTECQKYGKDWDLIYFNNPIEYEAINNVLKRNCIHHMSWWVGYNEEDYEVTTIYGRNINDGLLNWFGSLNWASTNPETPEPNDKLGKETCVRMKEGLFNDAMCYVKHQGPKRKNVGMGYICERHEPKESDSSLIATNAFCSLLMKKRDSSSMSIGQQNKACKKYGHYMAKAFRRRKSSRACSSDEIEDVNLEDLEDIFKTSDPERLLEMTKSKIDSRLNKNFNCSKKSQVSNWKSTTERKLELYFEMLN